MHLLSLPQPEKPTQYRAIGIIEGQYLPSQEDLSQGIIKTYDGTLIEANLTTPTKLWLRHNMENLQTHKYLSVWLRFFKNKLVLFVMGFKDSCPSEDIGKFSIRGQLHCWDKKSGKIVLLVRRNIRPEKNSKEAHSYSFKPFKVHLIGTLKDTRLKQGQFWDIVAQLKGTDLQILSQTKIKDPKPKRTNKKILPNKKNIVLAKTIA